MGGVNDDEIGDFLRLTEHPWEVRFIEPCPYLLRPLSGERFLPAGVILDRFRPSGLPGTAAARRYQLPGAQGTVGLISP